MLLRGETLLAETPRIVTAGDATMLRSMNVGWSSIVTDRGERGETDPALSSAHLAHSSRAR